MASPDEAFDRCGRCGGLKSRHVPVNYADGPAVGATVLLCPTSTYRDPREAEAEDDTVAKILEGLG